MKNRCYIFMITIVTYTFYALCYPEYVMLPDVYEYIGEYEYQKDPIKDFYNILDADSGEIVIKSHLLEKLREKIDMEGKQTCQTSKKTYRKLQ